MQKEGEKEGDIRLMHIQSVLICMCVHIFVCIHTNTFR